ADELDAIETINSRCLWDRYNQRAAEFAAEHNLPATGGSDAHFVTEVGQAHTVVDVERDICQYSEKLEAVKEAIRDGRISPVGSTGTNLVHAGTKIVKLYNRFQRA
ncbi:MAG: PHP-associated domain-containing protein, partial [Halobacteriaceae archaeon]